MNSTLRAEGITVGYGEKPVLRNVDVDIPDGEVTVIVGPNACGKSTLLKTLARLLTPAEGTVWLGEEPINARSSKDVARTLGLLPQSPTPPDGILVSDLVSRGRYPHQKLLQQWSKADDLAVREAMEHAGVADLAERPVSDLSGGQRQRVWLAMVLAQQTPIILLDEPTTYLDISHQVEVLNLAEQLHREWSTVVMVLHELTLAFRYATHLIVMKDGQIVARGPVNEIVTQDLIADVYGLRCNLLHDEIHDRPIVVPLDPV